LKTHFVFNNFVFENRVVYEIRFKNNVELGVAQMIIPSMRFACWTHTYTKYVISISFRPLHWGYEIVSWFVTCKVFASYFWFVCGLTVVY